MSLKNHIRELRKARKWSQAELADRCNTTNQQISHLETGKRRLTADWMDTLAKALQVDPQDLLVGGPGQLAPKERELVDLYRRLTADQQQAFLAMAKTFSPRESPPAD